MTMKLAISNSGIPWPQRPHLREGDRSVRTACRVGESPVEAVDSDPKQVCLSTLRLGEWGVIRGTRKPRRKMGPERREEVDSGEVILPPEEGGGERTEGRSRRRRHGDLGKI